MNMVTEKVKTYGYGGEYLPRSLTDAVRAFSKDWLSIPAEYRESAEIDFEPVFEYGESYACVRITYERPETDEEAAERLAGERGHWEGQLKAAADRVAYCQAQIDELGEGRG